MSNQSFVSVLRFDKFIIAELDSNASGFNEINENNYKNVYCGEY